MAQMCLKGTGRAPEADEHPMDYEAQSTATSTTGVEPGDVRSRARQMCWLGTDQAGDFLGKPPA